MCDVVDRIEVVARFIHGGVVVSIEDEQINTKIVSDSELLLYRTLTVVLPPRERLAVLEWTKRQTLEMELCKGARPSVEIVSSQPGASLLRSRPGLECCKAQRNSARWS